MGVLKRNLWLTGLGVVMVVVAFSGVQARAQTNVNTLAGTSTDRPGSVVLFPKIIADGTRDTIVLLTNTMNMPVSAHCVYVNGAGFCSISGDLCSVLPPLPNGTFRPSDCPDENDACEPAWIETNFDVSLTAKQPTLWRVSTGRILNDELSANGQCQESLQGEPPILRQECPGYFEGGNGVPPPNQPFRGELKCYETGPDEAPYAGNALKGEAIIETLGSPQISKYNSVNIEGDFDGGDQVLSLDGVEYNRCPASIEFTHYADLAPSIQNDINPDDCNAIGICSGPIGNGELCDPAILDSCGPMGVCVTCPVRTEMTLIPCTQNFEDQTPIPVTVQVNIYDEFESPRSAPHTVACWENAFLGDINPSGWPFYNRTQFLKTVVIPNSGGRCWEGEPLEIGTACDVDSECGAGGLCGPGSGVIGVMEEFHYTDASFPEVDGLAALFPAGTAAFNAHMNGLRIGACRGDLDQECESDEDCEEVDEDSVCLFDQIVIPEVVPAGF